MELTIWTLNRCTDLLAGEDPRIKQILSPHQVFFGERDRTGDVPRQLMPDIEYFVPIPLKCIGNKRRAESDPPAQKLLDAIVGQYSYLRDEKEFRSWWEEREGRLRQEAEDSFGKPHMTTEAGVGYYQLLEQHSNNILIGYSQGGLVARYLAFLDRHVFKKNIVTAVFTVSSPNWGSPLGNPSNKDDVAAGLLEFFLTAGSFHLDQFGTLYGLLNRDIHFEPIYKAIAAAEKDSRKSGHPAAEALSTAVKWLSGLDGNPNTAFAEIGIENFESSRAFSVLSLVNNAAYEPAGVYTAAVISANPDFDEILRSVVIGGKPEGWWRELVRLFKEIVLWVLRRVKVFGFSIGSNEQAAGTLYATKVMVENPRTPPTSIGQRLQAEYKSGKDGIPPYAHDFIIPSVYQLLPPSQGFLGHYVNLHASHNSGKSRDYPAGKDNWRALRRFIKELAGKLT